MVARRFPNGDIYLDEGMKKWIYRVSHKSYWRVARWMDLEDVIQEGFLCFAICRARYQPKNRAHFMSLVQITFINTITDLANKRTRTPECTISDIAEAGNDQEMLENLAGAEDSDAELAASLARAPEHVRMILAALNSDEGVARLRKPYRLKEDGTRETANDRLCRIAGVPTFDFEGTLRALLA